MSHVLTIKVEYYRSFEYSVKWKDTMNPKSKSRRPKTLKSQNNSCGEDSIQRRIGGKRQKKERNKALSGNTKVEMDKLSTDDIIDFIDRSYQGEPEESGGLVEVADEGLDHLDDDQVSVTSSVRSGPSLCHKLPAKAPLTLCPACRKLSQRAKRMKAPLKDKLLDTNPKSLTCDQWVLLKPWNSKDMPDGRRNLLGLSELIHKLSTVKKGKEKHERVTEEVCSRPHLFLQRNLQKPLKKEKKKNRRKRAREDCQGPRVAKQQRLLNNRRQPMSNDLSDDSSIQPIRNSVTHNSPDAMSHSCSTLFSENGEESDLAIRLRPMSVTLLRMDLQTDSVKVCPKQSVPKRGAGFKELLAQLRGNNSMIIRESTTEVTPKNHLSFTGWKRS